MNIPLTYLHQEQIQALYQSLSLSQNKCFQAVAFSFDDGDVFHIYTSPPKTQLAGYPCAAVIQFLDSIPIGEDGIIIVHQICNSTDELAIVVLFAFEENKLCHRVFIKTPHQICEGIVKFIPEHSELYSRNHGLLETSVLESKKVGVVGLGSGGSVVAVELAKAGIGEFILIDFDRLELSNISRHVCGTGDLGRYKTKAVRDLLYGKNPYVKVETAEININQQRDETFLLLKDCDLIIAATDNHRSRSNLNDIALEYKIPTIFGRALTRACGGDVLKVRPHDGPCLACIFTREFLDSHQEEITQFKQAREDAPAYVHDEDVNAAVQVGLSSDILPISNMIVKLALVELSKNAVSGIGSLEEDLIADFYIWANRREQTYSSWPKMEYGSRTPSILRWYGAKWERNLSCPVCGELPV